jgi:hypothetical protein
MPDWQTRRLPGPTPLLTGRTRARQEQQQQRAPMFAAQTRAGCPYDIAATRYRHVTGYERGAAPFFDLFDAVARARSRSPPPRLETTSPPDSPPTLHFPSSPPPGLTTSSNDTGNAASPNSSSSSSDRNFNLQDTAESGLKGIESWAAPMWTQAECDEAPTPSPPAAGNCSPTPSLPDERIVPDGSFERQNLNSHGTHSVPAQVIANLYSSHFSTRENVAAESQEIAEIYNRHFPDAWYSMPENAVADAEAAAVAIAHNTAAGMTDTVASTNDTVASTDDAVASNEDSIASANIADNCNNESDSSYDPNEESYIATYDDAVAARNEHYYTRQRRGRPDWGIQDPGWMAPRAPTAHPEAKPPSNHRLQDWNVNVTSFTDKTGYTIENDDVIYRLPSAPGNTV